MLSVAVRVTFFGDVAMTAHGAVVSVTPPDEFFSNVTLL
jgi:hypothetical protein